MKNLAIATVKATFTAVDFTNRTAFIGMGTIGLTVINVVTNSATRTATAIARAITTNSEVGRIIKRLLVF